MKKLILILALAVTAMAQQAPQQPSTSADGHQVVEIRLNQAPVAPVPSTVNEFVKGAQDLGAAIGGGLKNLAHETKDMTFGKDKTIVEGLDDLSKTDAGKFTMAAIAWKVAGRDAMTLISKVQKIVIGIPLFIAWNGICLWFWRKNFAEHSVVKTAEGPWWNRKKTYVVVNEDSSWSEGKCAAGFITGLLWAGFSIVLIVNICLI